MKRKKPYILIMLLFVGCITLFFIEKKEEKEIVVDGIEQKIVFIINKQQFNDHYFNQGFFIDNMGNRCYFDLSKEADDYAYKENLYEYLIEHMEEYEKEPYLEKEQLYEAYKHLLMIDDNAEVKEVCTGSADVGAFRYFGVRPDKDEEMEIILLEEYGDWERKNLDKNVNDIMEIISRDNWERDIWQKSKKETD